jgi:hypothetical protein
LENHLTQTCRQSTLNGYRDQLERYTKSYLWHMRIRDIDPDHIIGLMKQLENHGLNHTSRKRVRGVVGNIMRGRPLLLRQKELPEWSHDSYINFYSLKSCCYEASQ